MVVSARLLPDKEDSQGQHCFWDVVDITSSTSTARAQALSLTASPRRLSMEECAPRTRDLPVRRARSTGTDTNGAALGTGTCPVPEEAAPQRPARAQTAVPSGLAAHPGAHLALQPHPGRDPGAAAAAIIEASEGKGGLVRMVSMRTMQHAASLTRAELARLARNASLASKNSLISLNSAGSLSTQGSESADSNKLAEAPVASRPSIIAQALAPPSTAGGTKVVPCQYATTPQPKGNESAKEGADSSKGGAVGAVRPPSPDQTTSAQSDGKLVHVDATATQRGMAWLQSSRAASNFSLVCAHNNLQIVEFMTPASWSSYKMAGCCLAEGSLRQMWSPFSVPEAVRKRGSRDFDGLYIGKLIGTGSFGRVYEGAMPLQADAPLDRSPCTRLAHLPDGYIESQPAATAKV
jgi:hypothetical protein